MASGPLLAAISAVLASGVGLPTPAVWTAAISAWCVAWWITEPVPIPATSLIPFAAFPAADILDHKAVASAYGHTLILLLMGGFVPLLLGLAYAASIGGMGTPVGTPPNVIFMGIYREATGTEISFLQWMTIGIPAVMILLPIAWLWLTRNLTEVESVTLPTMRPWRPAERRVLGVFGMTALLWITRTAPFGGWSVARAAVVVLFVLPDGEGGKMLDWETAREIPWGLLLLFGGGISIARAFEASGLSV